MIAFTVFIQHPCEHLDVKPSNVKRDSHCWFCGLEAMEITALSNSQSDLVEAYLLTGPSRVRDGFMERVTHAMLAAVKSSGQGFKPQ